MQAAGASGRGTGCRGGGFGLRTHSFGVQDFYIGGWCGHDFLSFLALSLARGVHPRPFCKNKKTERVTEFDCWKWLKTKGEQRALTGWMMKEALSEDGLRRVLRG